MRRRINMRIVPVLVSLFLMIPSFSMAQAENEVICRSLVEPTNIKTFEDETCPFGWVEVHTESDEESG